MLICPYFSKAVKVQNKSSEFTSYGQFYSLDIFLNKSTLCA